MQKIITMAIHRQVFIILHFAFRRNSGRLDSRGWEVVQQKLRQNEEITLTRLQSTPLPPPSLPVPPTNPHLPIPTSSSVDCTAQLHNAPTCDKAAFTGKASHYKMKAHVAKKWPASQVLNSNSYVEYAILAPTTPPLCHEQARKLGWCDSYLRSENITHWPTHRPG